MRHLGMGLALFGCGLFGCVDEPSAPALPDIEDLGFASPIAWATPLTDYFLAAEEALGSEDFLRGVHDLAVFDDLLFFGYGDANLNVGRDVPIQPRRWADPEDPRGWVAEFDTDDEQIDRYRALGDLLVIPGIDATEDAWLGNAYMRPTGGQWSKSRTLDQGVHVHDLARLDDTLFGCGSGSTPEEWDDSNIHFLLWRSDDLGATFELAGRLANPLSPGDSRCTSLAVVGGDVYGFGYRTDSTFAIRGFVGARLEGGQGEPEELDWTSDLFVTDTVPLDEDAALLTAVRIGLTNRWELQRLRPDGARDVDSYADRTVLVSGPLSDGRALIIDAAGTTYPTPALGELDLAVSWTDGRDRHELFTVSPDALPSAVAWWRGAVYIGLEDGSVLRSVGD
jgi:hypothetical protein